MSGRIEPWEQACGESGALVYPIEGSGDTALYEVKTQYTDGRNDFYTSPVYIGFVDGWQVCAVENMQSALASWRNRKRERRGSG